MSLATVCLKENIYTAVARNVDYTGKWVLHEQAFATVVVKGQCVCSNTMYLGFCELASKLVADSEVGNRKPPVLPAVAKALALGKCLVENNPSLIHVSQKRHILERYRPGACMFIGQHVWHGAQRQQHMDTRSDMPDFGDIDSCCDVITN